MTEPAPTIAAVVGRNLTRLREQHHWTQAQVAARLRERGLNWSPNMVAKVETGLKAADNLGDLMALCEVFDVPVREFMAGAPKIRLGKLSEQRRTEDVLRALASGGPGPAVGRSVPDGYEMERIVALTGLPDEGTVQEIVKLLWPMAWSFFDERDRRAGVGQERYGLPALTREQARTARAGATKTMLTELRAAIKEHGGIDELIQYLEGQRVEKTRRRIAEADAVEEALTAVLEGTPTDEQILLLERRVR